jgi:hypothetical protein
MADRIPFAEATRGLFVARWPVPVAGFRWEDTLPGEPTSDRTPEDQGGPWLIEIDGGEGEARYQFPLRRGDIYRRFARLKTQRVILQFPNRYGFLGCDQRLVWSTHSHERSHKWGIPLASRWPNISTRGNVKSGRWRC